MTSAQLLHKFSACIAFVFIGQAHAGLNFWVKDDLMIVHGRAETLDHEKLSKALTPNIKTVVMREQTGGDWYEAKQLALVIKKARVKTVAHGGCSDFTCSMMFLAGEERVFSGVAHPRSHSITIRFGVPEHVMQGTNIRLADVHSWWSEHTKLGRSDLVMYKTSFFEVTSSFSSNWDRKVFFPPEAKLPDADSLHCSGRAKSQWLVDCMRIKGDTALSKGIVTSDSLFTDPRLNETNDVAVVATGFADIKTKPAIPLGDKCQQNYEDFLRQESPRAFVVSSSQGCYWASLGFRPIERAMQNCEKNKGSGTVCRVYAADDQVVFTPFNKPMPSISGAPATLPVLSSTLVLDTQNTSLILARSASKDEGPSGVNDRFTLEGRVVAYLTFKWDTAALKGSSQDIEVRWLNGDKLVSSQRQKIDLTESPQRTWLSILSADIGTGSAKVEVLANGKPIVDKRFTVAEKP